MKKRRNTTKFQAPNAPPSATKMVEVDDKHPNQKSSIFYLVVACIVCALLWNRDTLNVSFEAARKSINAKITPVVQKEYVPSECAAPNLYDSPQCADKCLKRSLESIYFPDKIAVDTVYTNISCHHCPEYKKQNTLFSSVEKYLSGTVLDSGTGKASLKFLTKVQRKGNIGNITAVTASESMYRHVVASVEKDSDANVVIGNWADEDFLKDQMFDTILMDYLVGSMDAFAPYTQELVFQRLARHVKVGGKMIVIGWEPIPDKADSPGDLLLLDVIRTQNTCILLGNGHTYREFPRHVIERYMKLSNIGIEKSMSFPIVYGQTKLQRLLNSCDHYLKLVKGKHGKEIRNVMDKRVKELRGMIDANTELREGLCFGMDYAIVGEKL
jgi:hypothetical protein